MKRVPKIHAVISKPGGQIADRNLLSLANFSATVKTLREAHSGSCTNTVFFRRLLLARVRLSGLSLLTTRTERSAPLIHP